MRVIAKIEMEFNLNDEELSTIDDVENYVIDSFVDDIYKAVKSNEIHDVIRVEITEKGLGR